MPSPVQIEPPPSTPATHGGMFRAFSHRNYRVFWVGVFISNIGTWMQAVAQGWLVLLLTDSPFWLGVDGFMATAPGLILTLVGGVFADLVDRRRLLLYTQITAGLSALVLAILIVTDVVQVWMVLGASFVTGCAFALAGPSYQAITIDLVGREDLPNAIALNSIQFQLSRAVGPALAGVAIGVLGLAGAFFANSASFIAVIAALLMIRPEAGAVVARYALSDRRAFWKDFVNGLHYVSRRPRVFMLLTISAVTSLFGAPYLTLVPVFARDIFNMAETGLALMMGVSGAGAFVGAMFLAALGNFRHKGYSVLGGAFAFSIFLVGFALARTLWVSLAFLFGMGFAIVCCVSVINTLLQQLVRDRMRGRVMSMFVFSFIGAMPIGNLLAGTASERFGAPVTLTVAGTIIAVYIALVTLRNKALREL